MTCNFTRTALALALALSLAGCGGKASFPVSGTVTGLAFDGLSLSTNGMTLQVPAKSTMFTFPNSLSYGDAYAVTVSDILKTQPQHETCVVSNGSDIAGRLASIDVTVTCGLNAFTVGGVFTVDGVANTLMPASLILTNGSSGGIFTTAAGATIFTFGVTIPYSFSYGVTVYQQPAGFTCTVGPNGTGIMGDANVVDIAVDCKTNT